jgi:ferrous iron transport protein A
MAMGLTTGTTFQIIRAAPLGDPIEIRVRGFSLSLRRAEAAIIEVERAL